jgi:hypothetical protein
VYSTVSHSSKAIVYIIYVFTGAAFFAVHFHSAERIDHFIISHRHNHKSFPSFHIILQEIDKALLTLTGLYAMTMDAVTQRHHSRCLLRGYYFGLVAACSLVVPLRGVASAITDVVTPKVTHHDDGRYRLGHGHAGHIHHHLYLDVQPANTTRHLEILRALPLKTYHVASTSTSITHNNDESVSGDGSPRQDTSTSSRRRIGFVGPDIASLVPEAVEVLEQRRVISAPARGNQWTGGDDVSSRIMTQNIHVPVVHEHTLFMYGIGATQELSTQLEQSRHDLEEYVKDAATLQMEMERTKQLLKREANETTKAQQRAIAAKAQQLVVDAALELQRTQDEDAYVDAQAQTEQHQIAHMEELSMKRLLKEEEAATARAEAFAIKAFTSSQQVEAARMEADETLSRVKHERELEIQREKESMKVETAKV